MSWTKELFDSFKEDSEIERKILDWEVKLMTENSKHRCFFNEVRNALGDLAGHAEELEKSLIDSGAKVNLSVYSCFKRDLEKAWKIYNDSSFGVCDICGASYCLSDHK